MHTFFKSSNVPSNRRLLDLTFLMLGSGKSDFTASHPGFTIKLKAAETSTMHQFCLDLLPKQGRGLPHFDDLLAAGVALLEYSTAVKLSPVNVTHRVYQAMMDACVKHLVHPERACIGFVPKHHLWVHMVHRSQLLISVLYSH